MKKFDDQNTLSILIFLSAAVWGIYWYPLREIESFGLTSSWSVVLINACPLVFLCPTVLVAPKTFRKSFRNSAFPSLMIGLAFTFYANSLVETTVIRATLLFYLNPIWGTVFGITWLSERLTTARILSISVAILGLFLLLHNSKNSGHPINVGDLFALLSGLFWATGASALKKTPNTSILVISTFVYLATTLISIIFATLVYSDPLPSKEHLVTALPTAALWSTVILLPGFMVIFKISQLLFPGRVGILMMSEVIVAIISASILIPNEGMVFLQWIGAIAIIVAALIEISFGYKRTQEHTHLQSINRLD